MSRMRYNTELDLPFELSAVTSVRDLCTYELTVIRQLQETVDGVEGMGDKLQLVSKIGDPALVFALYFPLLAGLSWKSGVRFMASVVACEWANLLLKLVFRGDRPYWFAYEFHESLGSPAPTYRGQMGHNPKVDYVHPRHFRQNPLTCETGPGFPSGHVMLNFVVWMIASDTISTKLVNRVFDPISSPARFLCRLLFNVFIGIQFGVSGSRIYNLNHFPHQCLGAMFFGLLAIKFAYSNQEKWMGIVSRRRALAVTSLIPVTYAVLTWTMEEMGMDTNWTQHKALRFCEERRWIKVETVPFYAFVRCFGAAVGLAMAAGSDEPLPSGGSAARERSADSEPLPKSQQALRALYGVLAGALSTEAHRMVPKANVVAFYCLALASYIWLTYFVLTWVPYLARVTVGVPTTPELSSEEVGKSAALRKEEEFSPTSSPTKTKKGGSGDGPARNLRKRKNK